MDWNTWLLGLLVIAVVIAIAAVLLILVQSAAQRILTLAVAALGLVKDIRANTQIVWALEDTNKTAVKILEGATSIKQHGAALANALHETPTGWGKS